MTDIVQDLQRAIREYLHGDRREDDIDWHGLAGRALRELKALRREKIEGDRVHRGLQQVRLRHMYGHHRAGEALSVWILNGNSYDNYHSEKAGYYAKEDEIAYVKHMELNRQLRSIAANWPDEG